MYQNKPQCAFTDRLVSPDDSTQLPMGPIDTSKRKQTLSRRAEKRVARKAKQHADELAIDEKEKQRKEKSPLFYCTDDSCSAKYTTERGCAAHIASGKHMFRSTKSLKTTVGDYLRKTRLNTLVPASSQVQSTQLLPVLECCFYVFVLETHWLSSSTTTGERTYSRAFR